MISARKHALFDWCFNRYNRLLIRSSFGGMYIRGEGVLAPPPRDTSVLYLCNHASWWDGLVAYDLNRRLLRRSAYVMMSEEGLRAYPFFRLLGAFSVNRRSLASVRRSLAYGLEKLQEPGAALWLFPQGDIRHQDVRPLQFLPGVSYYLERVSRLPNGLQIVPVALYYSFGLKRKPELFIEIGRGYDAAGLTGIDCERLVTEQLDRMREEAIAGVPAGYTALLRGSYPAGVRLQSDTRS